MDTKVVDVKSSHGLRMLSSGVRLKAERQRIGLTQQEMADRVRVHRQTQVNYEADRREPPADYLDAIAQLGIDTRYVMTGLRSDQTEHEAIASAALLRFLIQALGYQDPESVISKATRVWESTEPQPPGGLEGLAGELVGNSRILDSLRKHSQALDVDLFLEAWLTAKRALEKRGKVADEKVLILAAHLYNSAGSTGNRIDPRQAELLASLAD